MIPVWFCIVKIEMIDDRNGFHGYRMIKAIPITSDKYRETWEAEMPSLLETGSYQAMLFIREPDTTPMKETYLKELQEDV